MATPHRSRPRVEPLEARDLPSAAPFDTLPVLPGGDLAALDHARAIAWVGHMLGRRADVFLKVGDSNTDFGPMGDNTYLKPLGAAGYNPVAEGVALYGTGLVDTWATYRNLVDGVFNSFDRPSSTAYPGYSLPRILPNLAGELAATNAGVALVMIGTNDITTYGDPGQFRALLGQLVTTLEVGGVVPILSTVPDNHYAGGALEGQTRVFNQVIADLAADERLPLWNLFRQVEGLPNEGLDAGGVHLTYLPDAAGNLGPVGLTLGQNVHNLGALQSLDWFRTQVATVGTGADLPALSPAWTPLPAGRPVYAVGLDIGQGPVVSVYDAGTGQELDRFLAFEPSFRGGVRVAVADVDGDGVPDVVATPGPGGGPVVKVFSGADGALLASFFAFEPSFRTGQTVAARDLDGDGRAEVVVGAGVGGGPAVAVYHGGDFAEVRRFFAFDPALRSGVSVAAGSFAGVGPGVAVAAGPGGGPVVELFDYNSGGLAGTVLAGDPSNRDGLSLAAGDLDGDGFAELVAGAGGAAPLVRVFDPATGAEREELPAGPGSGGVRLAVQWGSLLVADGPGGPSVVRAYAGLSPNASQLPPLDDDRAYGLFVG